MAKELTNPKASTEGTSHGNSAPAEDEVSDFHQQHGDNTKICLLCCKLPWQRDTYTLQKAI